MKMVIAALVLVSSVISTAANAAIIKGEATLRPSLGAPSNQIVGNMSFKFETADFNPWVGQDDPPPSNFPLTVSHFVFEMAGTTWTLEDGVVGNLQTVYFYGPPDVLSMIRAPNDWLYNAFLEFSYHGPKGDFYASWEFVEGAAVLRTPFGVGTSSEGPPYASLGFDTYKFVVPEPATMALLASGLIGFGLRKSAPDRSKL